MEASRSWRLGLRTVALAYLALLLLIPVGLVFYRTFEPGVGAVWDYVTTPAAISAFWLTIEVAAIAVPINTVLGVVAALALARGRFRGKALLDAIIDLPFVIRAVEPVLIELDREMEEAAVSLGAGPWAVFWQIVLPNLLPAILSVASLAFARSFGEFGSVVLV